MLSLFLFLQVPKPDIPDTFGYRFLVLLSLIFATSTLQAEEVSIEELIQRNVVEVCEQLNKPQQKCTSTKDLNPIEVSVPPSQAQSLNRCDPAREDVPMAAEMTSYSEKTFPVSRLSEKDVQEVFNYVSKQKRRYVLNEGWAATGACAARSHLIAADIARDCKVNSGKVFVNPSRSAWTLWLGKNSLWVEAKGRKFRWDKFHVANVVYVEKNGKAEPYIIDPILFDQAVPQKEWEALVKSQDSSANSWVTSSKAFAPSDRHEDDPENAVNIQQAQELIEKARRDQRILQRSKGL